THDLIQDSETVEHQACRSRKRCGVGMSQSAKKRNWRERGLRPAWPKLLLCVAGYPSMGDGHRSFSASLRKSSGTEREMSCGDPYPIASQPKRSRILSTAQSTAQ